jgi:hypothetical protein
VELHLAQASARLERADDLGREQEWEWEDLAGRGQVTRSRLRGPRTGLTGLCVRAG